MQNKGNIQEKTITIPAAEYQSLLGKSQDLEIKVAQLQHQYEQLKRMIFGSKSERFIAEEDNNQLKFDFGETIEEKPVEEKPTEEVTYKRKKKSKGKQPVRVPLPPHLPREKHILEPTDKKEGDRKIGETITEILEYQEAKLYVKSYHRPKYATPGKDGVKVAELPSLPIPRGNAGPGLLAYLTISKFIDHLPFYRQRQILKRYGLEIAESTINDWFSATCQLLEPLYGRLHHSVLGTDYLMADETPISVLTATKPGSTHKGYHWVYYSPLHKLVYFDYRKGRGRDGPEEILKNYTGALQTDGYIAYDSFGEEEDIILLACMAHARRKFEQAQDNDPKRASYVLKQIQHLYNIERTAREQEISFAKRKELRQKESLPILNELHNYLKTQLREVLPKSAMGGAIAYT
ncbi:MAG: IS66 family transposase, partial [Salinivirgaceae bacterium]